jgi:hypothetical protein
MCSYWIKDGTCARDAYCTFAHGQEDLHVKKRAIVAGQTPLLSSRAGLHLPNQLLARRALKDEGRRHSASALTQHIGFGFSPLTVADPKKDWFDMRFKGSASSLDHMDQFDKSHGVDEHDKSFGSSKAGIIGLMESTMDEDKDERNEAIALLTGDMDRLSPYSLTPLKQLRTLLQDARAAVDEVISNYDANHPTRTCTKCSAPVRSIALPCNHAVECDRCLQDEKSCSHCQCAITRTVGIKRDLPTVLLSEERH